MGIIIIPFVFWGMGSSFVGGNKNIIVEIDKQKYTIQEFVDYIKKFTDKHFICDFDGDSKSFYKHDPHPNSFGYNKLYKCVKEIISKKFAY